MTVALIKQMIVNGGKIGICKHRRFKCGYEHFFIFKNGKDATKISAKQSKSIQRWLATSIININSKNISKYAMD